MTQHGSTVGSDLAKNIFPLVGTDTTGRMVWRTRLTRHALVPLMAQLPPVTIGLEAWGGAHDWARPCHQQGHHVKRMAPPFVKPYVQSHTNERRDAEAMAEAVTRPTMRVVPLTDVAQQDLQALPRVRARRIGARTALINAGHGFRHAYGSVMPPGVSKFRRAVVEKLESEQDTLTPLSQAMCWRLVQEVAPWEEDIAAYQEQRDTLAKLPPESPRLMTIPGVGPSTAPALVAAVGEVGVWKHGRQCAAW